MTEIQGVTGAFFLCEREREGPRAPAPKWVSLALVISLAATMDRSLERWLRVVGSNCSSGNPKALYYVWADDIIDHVLSYLERDLHVARVRELFEYYVIGTRGPRVTR